MFRAPYPFRIQPRIDAFFCDAEPPLEYSGDSESSNLRRTY